MRMGDPGAQVRCEAIPTGALSLDLDLGVRYGVVAVELAECPM